MSNQKVAPSFDDIIAAGRKKKQHEALANQLLGSGRRSSAPAALLPGRRGAASGAGSLASRAGISKTNGGVRKPLTTFKSTAAPTAPASRPQALNRAASNPQLNQQLNRRNQIIQSALNGSASPLRNQVNIRGPARTNGVSEISIRGMSSRGYTVIAQNFALGTTASDIEAVLAPEGEGVGLLSCRLISANPTVIAELVFAQADPAEAVVEKYNNKKADGRLLHVWVKNMPPKYNRSRGTMHGTNVLGVNDNDIMMDTDQSFQQPPSAPRNHISQNRGRLAYEDGTQGFPDTAQEFIPLGSGNYDGQQQQRQSSARGRGRPNGRLNSDDMVPRRSNFGRR